MLNEAREIADLKYREEETLLETKKFLYSYWFDEYQGEAFVQVFLIDFRKSFVCFI